MPGQPGTDAAGDRHPDRRAAGGHLPPRRRAADSGVAGRQPLPARSALAGPAAVLRVLPRRHRPGSGRRPSDRLDRPAGESGDAPLPPGHPGLLEPSADGDATTPARPARDWR
ncbi:MAG: hypothetical protein MZV63_19300 [Marinilabiliales bacterium]|nr:hypothetical protein [Marinilabiliales bacterium]